MFRHSQKPACVTYTFKPKGITEDTSSATYQMTCGKSDVKCQCTAGFELWECESKCPTPKPEPACKIEWKCEERKPTPTCEIECRYERQKPKPERKCVLTCETKCEEPKPKPQHRYVLACETKCEEPKPKPECKCVLVCETKCEEPKPKPECKCVLVCETKCEEPKPKPECKCVLVCETKCEEPKADPCKLDITCVPFTISDLLSHKHKLESTQAAAQCELKLLDQERKKLLSQAQAENDGCGSSFTIYIHEVQRLNCRIELYTKWNLVLGSRIDAIRNAIFLMEKGTLSKGEIEKICKLLQASLELSACSVNVASTKAEVEQEILELKKKKAEFEGKLTKSEFEKICALLAKCTEVVI